MEKADSVGASPVADFDRVLAERDALTRALDASRAREALLTNELQHRVRNVLAIVRSLFTRTSEAAASLEDVINHFPGRLDAVARYQARSASLADLAFDLEEMIRDELLVFAFSNDPRIEIIGPEVGLEARVAEVMGLALHELTTNSVKYGVLAAQSGAGQLSISWTVTDRRLAFLWVESGIPIVSSAPTRCGFGRDYLEQALPYQIGADAVFAAVPGGVRWQISLPMRSL
jgi:two-component sensor histidine kinase